MEIILRDMIYNPIMELGIKKERSGYSIRNFNGKPVMFVENNIPRLKSGDINLETIKTLVINND